MSKLTFEQIQTVSNLKQFKAYYQVKCGSCLRDNDAYSGFSIYTDFSNQERISIYWRCSKHPDGMYKLTEKEVFTIKCLHNL